MIDERRGVDNGKVNDIINDKLINWRVVMGTGQKTTKLFFDLSP